MAEQAKPRKISVKHSGAGAGAGQTVPGETAEVEERSAEQEAAQNGGAPQA